MAHSYKAGEIDIGHPWSRAAPAGVTGAGYLTLTNKGSTPTGWWAPAPRSRAPSKSTAAAWKAA
ncbi:hypothetical protein ACFQU7_11190 [Pseudoroseomonas wenyumeiae]